MSKERDTAMPEIGVPYLNAYGNITKALNKIVEASTPDRFTLDFLSTKLGLKGGSARPIVPFLKRTGFLNSDGTPTERYKRFRNSAYRGAEAAAALKGGYGSLYEINEYAHELSDKDLKEVVVQATGAETGSSTVKGIVGSFKALKDFAKFDGDEPEEVEEDKGEDEPKDGKPRSEHQGKVGLNLGYTINLNLPATSDIAVFDAIFKSLREHLLNE